MTRFTDALREKIDSEEKFAAALEARTGTEKGKRLAWDYGFLGAHHIHEYSADYPDSWWYNRENQRLLHGVYPPTTAPMQSVIEQFKMGMLWLHTSPIDKNMIAYTPDRESGLKDKQIATTYGKFLRKFCPTASDKWVAAAEAEYRASLTDDFDIARTKKEIHRIYTTMRGDNGCMRYSSEHFGLPADVHPSNIYEAPGMGVAFVEVEGQIKARSVIWENPDDPTDKRYIRIYGDQTLAFRLKRKGFIPKALTSAKIRLCPVDNKTPKPGKAFKIALSYMDGVEGDQSQADSQYGIHVEGEEFIQILTAKQKQTVDAMRLPTINVRSTGGTVTVTSAPPGSLLRVCATTGFSENMLEGKPKKTWHKILLDNKVVDTVEPPNGAVMAVTHHAGNNLSCFVVGDTKTFTYQGTVYHANKETMSAMGVGVLSKQFYPGEDVIVRTNELCYIDSGEAIRRTDATYVLDEKGESSYVHNTVAANMLTERSAVYVRFDPTTDIPRGLVHSKNPNLHETTDGKLCVEGTHKIVKLWDDRWAKESKTVMKSLFGAKLVVLTEDLTNGTIPAERIGNEFDVNLTRVFGEYPNEEKTWKQAYVKSSLRDWLNSGLAGVRYTLTGKDVSKLKATADTTTTPDINAMLHTAAVIAASEDQRLKAAYEGKPGHARMWSQVVLALAEFANARFTAMGGAVLTIPNYGVVAPAQVPVEAPRLAVPVGFDDKLAEAGAMLRSALDVPMTAMSGDVWHAPAPAPGAPPVARKRTAKA